VVTSALPTVTGRGLHRDARSPEARFDSPAVLGRNRVPRVGRAAHKRVATVTKEELEQRIFDIVREDILTVDDSFTRQSNLIEAGLDSLALTQLMLAIEEATGVWVDESLLTEDTLASVETLAALVQQQLG